MNLHGIVRGAITMVNPDEPCQLLQAEEVENNRGILSTSYKPLQDIRAQWQPIDKPMTQQDGMTTTTEAMTVYLYSKEEFPVSGISRVPAARSGDYLFRKDGTWWLITDVKEDWSGVGWACVNAVKQVEPPEGYDDDYESFGCC